MKKMLFTEIDPEICNINRVEIAKEECLSDKLSYSHRLLMVTHGTCKLTVNGYRYNLNVNDMMYIPSDTLYSTEMKSGVQLLTLNFDFLRYNNILQKTNFIFRNEYDSSLSRETISFTDTDHFSKPFITTSCEILVEKINELLREESTRYYAYRLRQKAILTDMLVYLYRIRNVSSDEAKFSVTENILNYIIKHCEEPLSCTSIGEYFHFSPKTVQKMVRSVTGMTLHQYLEGARILKASELLADAELSVTEIAQRLQYYDSSHFSMVFKKYFSCTPLQYRKNHL